MRDPARIQRIISILEHIWTRAPDMRLGQLVWLLVARGHPEVTHRDCRIWHIEDDELEDGLMREAMQPQLSNETKEK